MRTKHPLAALTLVVVLASPVLAAIRPPDEPLAFVPIEVQPGSSLVGLPVLRKDSDEDNPSVPPNVGHPRPAVPPVRPIVSIPSPRLIVIRVDTGGLRSSGSHAVTGVASYFCNADPSRGRTSRCTKGFPDWSGDDLYAAIRRDLLDALRGRRVRVCATGSGRCVVVKVIDCNCGDNANLIDLYGDALARLVPLTMGTVKVRVSW